MTEWKRKKKNENDSLHNYVTLSKESVPPWYACSGSFAKTAGKLDSKATHIGICLRALFCFICMSRDYVYFMHVSNILFTPPPLYSHPCRNTETSTYLPSASFLFSFPLYPLSDFCLVVLVNRENFIFEKLSRIIIQNGQ